MCSSVCSSVFLGFGCVSARFRPCFGVFVLCFACVSALLVERKLIIFSTFPSDPIGRELKLRIFHIFPSVPMARELPFAHPPEISKKFRNIF